MNVINPRTFFLLIILGFISRGLLAQSAMLNYKTTTWKDKSTWIDNRIPTDTDHVVLLNSIVIDTNAVCRSLTTNGMDVTILPGYTLTITGKDSLQQPDNDTLISAIVWRRYLSEKDSVNINAYSVYKTFEYDSLKRIRLIVTKEEFADNELRFYYTGNSNLPYMTIKNDPCDYQEGDKCVVYADTSYYWYDGLERMVKDSTRAWSSNAPVITTRVDNYEYETDWISKIRRSNSPIYDPSGGWHLSAFTTDTLRVVQKMLLPNAHSQQSFVLPVYPGSTFYNYVFFVDQWENPLYRTSIHYPVAPPEQLFFDSPELKNNRVTYSRTDNYGYESYQLSYRYKANKLPVECILSFFYNDPGTVYAFSYEYTH